jgi:hypothetical protein
MNVWEEALAARGARVKMYVWEGAFAAARAAACPHHGAAERSPAALRGGRRQRKALTRLTI